MQPVPPDRDDEKPKEIRFRSDWFAEVLGEGWKSDGDGIYRLAPEPTSVRGASPGPTERPQREPVEDLDDAHAPSTRQQRADMDAEHPTSEHGDTAGEPSRGKRRSLWQRR
jgi:hypothetical protein